MDVKYVSNLGPERKYRRAEDVLERAIDSVWGMRNSWRLCNDGRCVPQQLYSGVAMSYTY